LSDGGKFGKRPAQTAIIRKPTFQTSGNAVQRGQRSLLGNHDLTQRARGKFVRSLIVAALMLTACSQGSSADAPQRAAGGVDGVDWIAGYWLSCNEGTQTAEAWIGAGSGLVVGVNHSLGRGAPSFEYMRIGPHEGGRLAFFGSPGGAPAVTFAMTSLEGQTATFENPTHDFPQRVIYSRSGDELIGRIEGASGGETQSMEWRYRAAALGEECPAQTE
jgi:hypothetical protein